MRGGAGQAEPDARHRRVDVGGGVLRLLGGAQVELGGALAEAAALEVAGETMGTLSPWFSSHVPTSRWPSRLSSSVKVA